jgi:hypothetical protein
MGQNGSRPNQAETARALGDDGNLRILHVQQVDPFAIEHWE